MTRVKLKSIDAYLARLDDDKRAALERLRKLIQDAAPEAEECISYQLPAFRLDGKTLIWFGAGAKHCAIYGVSETYKGEFQDYDTSGKGTLRFQPANPLPPALVRRLVKACIAKRVRGERAARGVKARGAPHRKLM
jgi:uncharacterized protein YdhG (YjbR/CyaY superfamily)